jgi:lambda family phage portal protein
MGRIADFIDAAFPSYALQRERSKERLANFREYRTYEGASRRERLQNWKTRTRDANSEASAGMARIVLRNRSRDLRMNNPFAKAAVEGWVDNAVGYGIKPRWVTGPKTRLAKYWAEHMETTAVDYHGKLNIYAIQALSMSSLVESGEVLLRRRWVDGASMRGPMPFTIQVLEADFLDDGLTQTLSNGNQIINGVEYSKNGRVENYWLFEQHPGAMLMTGSSLASKAVPAEDIIHVYRMDRPGQVRGVPWCSSVIVRLRNFDETEDAYIQREKIASCFAAFITDPDGADGDTAKELTARLMPGYVGVLPPGMSVEFGTPPTVNGYKDFSSVNLHAIAAGYEVPYEVFGDYSQVNFSSGRMSWQNFSRRIERVQGTVLFPSLGDGVARWFSEAGLVMGYWVSPASALWVPPRRMMVNPKEEIAAMKEAIRNGFETWGDTVLALGYNPETHAEAIAIFNKLLDKHGLKLDCDPRYALPQGTKANEDNSGKEPDGSGKKPAKDDEEDTSVEDNDESVSNSNEDK